MDPLLDFFPPSSTNVYTMLKVMVYIHLTQKT